MEEDARHPQSTQALAEVAQILGLTGADTASLLRVTLEELEDWYENGVPSNRVQDVKCIADLASALRARFIPERIPEIVRAPLPGLNELSILATIAGEGPAAVLKMLERAFSYAP